MRSKKDMIVDAFSAPDAVSLDGLQMGYDVGANSSYFKGLTRLESGFFQYIYYTYTADPTIAACTGNGSGNFTTIGMCFFILANIRCVYSFFLNL